MNVRPAVAAAVGLALAAAAGAAQAAEQGIEEINITASRIERSGFEAPTPTTMIGAEQIEARAAVRMSQILFELPALRPTATAVPFSASAGGTYANLRNLNPGAPTQTATRTLVLVDGRRIVPNTATGLVDLNAIPTSLVERVDVVTGGASAAWGSDAVAGVTNFILKKKLEGLDVNVQGGMSQRSDFKEYSGSVAWGTGYADDRGQLMLAAEYSNLSDIASYGDREWGRQQYGWVTGTMGGRTITRIAIPGVVSSGVSAGGVIVSANGSPLPTTGPTSALRGIQFGPGGVPQPFTYGAYLSNQQMVGGSGPVLSTLSRLGAPVERLNAYGRTTFAFTDNLEGFAEVAYAESKSRVDTQLMYTPNGDPAYTIRRDNAFLPASIRNIMVANNLQTFALGRFTPEFGTYSLGESRTAAKRIAAGLEGDFGEGWSWRSYVGAGHVDYYDKALNNVNQPNLRASLDSVIGPDGTAICRINSPVAADIATTRAPGYQGAGAERGCVAANPFGPNSFSPAAVDYIIGTSWADADIDQRTAGFSINGEPFSTWAGEVSVAGGFDYRRDAVDQGADPIAQQTTASFQTGSWQFANRRPLKGSVNVKEVFAEAVVPLAKDAAWAKTLDLNAAVRTADYSTSGNVVSWKGGLSWEPVDSFRVRATRSRDLRAANLVELYTVGVSIVGAVVDYGRPGNPTASVPTTTLGNPLLDPEKADTTTVGFTWQPDFAPGLDASFDVWKIELEDAIGSLGGQNIVSGCYGRAPFTTPQPQLCSLISRDSNGVISNIANQSLNLAFTNTQGVDMEVGYRFDAAGAWNLRLLGTYVDKSDENNGIVTVDRAGQLGNSKWRMTGSAQWNSGPVGAYLQLRYIGAAKIDNTYGPNDILDNTVGSFTYLNGSVQYTLWDTDSHGRMQVFGNVNNILDKAPPIVPSASATPGQAPLAPDYDRIGRYFIIGARFHR